MKKGIALVALAAGVLALGGGPAPGKAAPMAGTTLADQTGIAITIYNDNLALVKDTRSVTLSDGTFPFKFEDVAANIDPTSISIVSLNDPANFSVLEQNYEYDLVNTQALLTKYLGKEVWLVPKDKTDTDEKTVATLLSTDGVYKIGEQIAINPPGRVVLPALPEGLISKPTLVWLLDSGKQEKHTLQASYLTSGMQWKADYVAVLNDKDNKLDLTGWVTITNSSGGTYKNATLKLVAGTVHRAPAPQPPYAMEGARMMAAKAAPQFAEESFFEYHLYTLDRPTTVADNETKQMTLLEANNAAVAKKFQLEGQRYYYQSRVSEKQEEKIGVYLELVNSKANNMGIPLPKGTFRVYKKDSSGSLQFIGEDSIDHTPKDETIRVKIGDAFDIAADRVQTDYRPTSDGSAVEVAFDITVGNHKNEDVVVEDLEPVWGEWKVISSTLDWQKASATFIRYAIPVKANGKTVLSYRIRTHW